MYRIKSTPDPIFTDVLKLDLASIEPSLAGPSGRRTCLAERGQVSFIQAMDRSSTSRATVAAKRCSNCIRRSRPHRWTRTSPRPVGLDAIRSPAAITISATATW